MMTINKYFNRRSLCSLSNVNVHISSIRVSCSAADRHEIEMQRLHRHYMMYTNRIGADLIRLTSAGAFRLPRVLFFVARL